MLVNQPQNFDARHQQPWHTNLAHHLVYLNYTKIGSTNQVASIGDTRSVFLLVAPTLVGGLVGLSKGGKLKLRQPTKAIYVQKSKIL